MVVDADKRGDVHGKRKWILERGFL